MECSVCYEETTNTTSCNHFICADCLIKLVRKEKNTCPMCREIFDTEPYKYVRPKHTPNLNLAKKRISMFNRFLRNRFFLEKNKKQCRFRNLMLQHAGLYYIFKTYISLNDNFFLYDNHLLLLIYVHLNTAECIYKQEHNYYLCTKIENVLCS